MTNVVKSESKSIFRKERIKFDPPEPIRAMTVCNNQIIMGLQSNIIIRINLNKSSTTDEIEISRDQLEKIDAIFTDPSGHHSIIVLASSLCLYLHNNSRKPKLFNKLKLQKGEKITSVAWNYNNSNPETSTGAILIGTSKGVLIETELLSVESGKVFGQNFEVYSRQVYCFSDFPQPITGLLLDRVPDSATSNHYYYLIVVLLGRLYQVCGVVNLTHDAPVYESLMSQLKGEFKDFRGVKMCSRLTSTSSTLEDGTGTRVAWLMDQEVFHGQVKACEDGGGGDVVCNVKLTPIYEVNDTKVQKLDKPLSIVTTHFHHLILFANRLNVVCHLDDRLVHTDLYDESFGQMLGLLRDPTKGTIWSFSSRAVYKHSIHQETKNIWRVYLALKQFKLARHYCTDTDMLDDISYQEADYLFDKGLHNESALVYARNARCFEEAALKLMRLPDKGALRTFLISKFNSMDVKETPQTTMILVWCVDLWLTHLGFMQSNNTTNTTNNTTNNQLINNPPTTITTNPFSNSSTINPTKTNPTNPFSETNTNPFPTNSTHPSTTNSTNNTNDKDKYNKSMQLFRSFVASPKALALIKANHAVIYDLLKSHADHPHLIYVASLIDDYETIIIHYIEHGKYVEVINELTKHPARCMTEFTYKFSPILIQHCPRQTVDFWIKRSTFIDPTKLIPSFILYERQRSKLNTQPNEVLRFLLYCTADLCLREQCLHNYLVALLVKNKMNDLLTTYLSAQGDDPELICYDAKYALRLCREQRLEKACIHLYTILGLYDEAVNLALQTDVNLACEVASKPVADEDVRRRLWLKVARHAVETEEDIEKTMQVVHGSHLVTIHDVLPFFPEFVTIDKFKDAICSSLKEYNEEIEALKRDMDEASVNTQQFKLQIAEFKNRSSKINNDDKCNICELPLSLRTFFIFPCHHYFHLDCLTTKIWPHLTSSDKQKVKDLRRKLTRQQQSQQQQSQQQPQQHDVDSWKQQLDDIIASDCLFCGEYMIDSIDKPFVEEDRLEEVLKSWS